MKLMWRKCRNNLRGNISQNSSLVLFQTSLIIEQIMARKRSNFFVQKFLLRMCGVSLSEHENLAYTTISFLLLVFVCAYPFLGLVDVFRQDFETVAELLKYEVIFLVGVMKIIVVKWNRAKLRELLDKLEPESFLENLRHTGDKEEALIKQCIFINTVQVIAYFCVTLFGYLFDVLMSLSQRIKSSDYHDWQFTFGSFNLVNATYSPNFEILWSYQNVCCFFVGTLFVMIDATIGGILCHICFELKILQNNLRCIVENSYEEMIKENGTAVLNEAVVSTDIEGSAVEWKFLHKSLKQAVEYHLAIIDITDDLNKTFSNLLLATFLGTLGMLAFMVYKTSMVPITDFQVFANLIEIIVISFQVLMVCFWSEQMMFESQEVGRAAYESNFVGTDLRFQKALIIIIKRSQTPLTLGAGKFVDINLATFVWITRSAYSVFTVLRNKV